MSIKTYSIQDELLMHPCSIALYSNVLILTQEDPACFFLWQWYQYPELFEAIDIELEELIFINQLNVEVDEYQRAELGISEGHVRKIAWHPIHSSVAEKLKQPYCCPQCNTIIGMQPKECLVCGEKNKLLEFEKDIEQPYYDEQCMRYAPILPPDGNDNK